MRISYGLIVFAVLLICLGLVQLAQAHDAPSGWSYPYSCCSDQDCRPVPEAAVRETVDGYVIVASGEVIPYADKRVRHSPDGEFHWCSVAGSVNGRTLCLFVPPRSF